MTVTSRCRVRATPERVHTKPLPPRTYTASLRTSSRWSFQSTKHSDQQPIERRSKGVAAVHSAVHYGEIRLGFKRSHILGVDTQPFEVRT
jgi:hypothetical protein